MERAVVKITRGVYWEASLEGGVIKSARLLPVGEETGGENPLRERLLPYLRGEGDPAFRLEELDLSGYSERVIGVFRILKESVPSGRTVTYGSLGELAGEHPRFVGYCMKINRFPLLIPCHRVTGVKDIGGFSYGEEIKRRLLAFERSLIR